MADGVTTQTAAPATIPDATEIATDDAGADGHVQLIKLAISADGSVVALPSDATNGMFVNVKTSVLPTGASTSAKQDTQATLLGGGLPSALATDRLKVDASGVAVPITDNAGSLTVDGTVTVNALPAGSNNIGDVDVLTLPALVAGSAAIGKLAANSGVDIGDVDVTSISAGTNAIGNVGVVPRTTGGYTTYHLASAATTNLVNVKASAGQLFGWYIYNSNAAARKVAFHNSASAPTAGASVFFSLVIPPTSAANVFSETGIAFSSGISISTVTGLADNDTAAVAANDLILNLFYA